MLSSFYRYSRTQIAEVLLPLIAAQVAAALNLMANANVDFLDAYLAEIARRGGESVVSFDKNFRRLQVNWIEPN